MPRIQCIICERWRSVGECKSLSSSTYSWFHDYLRSNCKVVNVEELYYCKGCTNSLYTIKKRVNEASEYPSSLCSSTDPEETEQDNDYLTFDNVFYAGSGHKKCVFCGKSVTSEMQLMPRSARLDVLLLHRVFVPHGVRCCSSHLINGTRLCLDQAFNLKDRSRIPTSLSSGDVRDLLDDFSSLFNELQFSPRLDFDDPFLTNEDYEAWTGWSNAQFDLIFDEVSSFLRTSENRTTRNAMAIFWIKLKTNLSFRQIGSLFNINGDSEKRRLCAAKAFDSVRNLLIEYFVPNHLGIGHMPIEDTKAHNTAYSKVSLSSFDYIRAK